MMDSIKAGLFSIPGFAVTIIHVLIVTGALCIWVLVRTQVLGVGAEQIPQWPTYHDGKK
jgi:hypothetical protein